MVTGAETAVGSPPGLASLCLATWLPVEPEGLLRAWSLAPAVVAPLAALLLVYLIGLRRALAADRGRPGLFLGGWLLLAVALVSPLCRLAAATASGHMAQHLVLALLAPALIAAACPWRVLRRGAGLPPRRRVAPDGPAAGSVAASIAYAVAIWVAHVPVVYQAALLEPGAHLLLLALLLAASLLFWTTLVEVPSAGARVAMALAAMAHTGLLGALLTLSPRPWYPVFAGSTELFGLTPTTDQQLAGLLMWVPMGGAYAVVALASVGLLLKRLERGEPPVAAARPRG
jgi:cytochrome c oxidase assembly factor CtaG